MTLTPIQRKLLEKYRTYRNRPYSFLANLATMLPMVLALAAFVVSAKVFVSTALALFAGGMAFGAILRQGSIAWRAVQLMPGLVEVIDWEKVDHLLNQSEPA